MKIFTENIDLEITIEEFENILNKGMLDMTITIIASLSERVGVKKNVKEPDDELTSLLNDILKQGSGLEDDDIGDFFSSFCDKDDCEGCNDCNEDDFEDDIEGELDEIDEQNEIVDRIYHNIFKNGERKT